MRVFLTFIVFSMAARAQELRAGYAKADITPTEPVYMAGYDMRDAPSDGVWGHDRLYARALVFEAGGSRLAFVEADVIIIRGTDEFRRRISDATGIPVEHILLGDAHNHAAPSPTAKLETNWDRQFEKGVLAAVTQAAAALQPARIAAGTGHSRIAMNRRKVVPADVDSTLTFDENDRSQSFGKAKTDNPVSIHEFAGVVRLGANPNGPIDDAVQIVRVDKADGKPLAVMIHYACHGTSLGGRNSKISGEWMGRMQEYVEKQFPGVGAIYLQGAAGDINPRVVGGLDGYKDNIETTWALGEEIGREAARVYRELSPEPLAAPRIQIETADIRLPRAYRELFEDFAHTVITAPTTVVRLGDLMWTTFPGELFSNIGKKVKAASPATYAHLMGYTNGYIGYFPERQAYTDGGYEVASTHLDPAAEGIYLHAISELMQRFR
ncbi:MAG TPA: neutral/alkaline non-lysosomal ceramidase N-terminal domain-containing protein [Bryobacteraceae bacterium]|nr:neutral/alkaline non-lysosomal ceramidase N-terminal domain-containing protein [Bryobacteraceae bacterium]